jgi:molecular chaperone DnaK
MAIRCGIDLGTTYSAISWYDTFNNRVVTADLESANGERILRSVVYYPGSGEPPVVGEAAWNAARHFRDRVIADIKRSMGRSFRTPPIDGVEHTPPQVSAEILKALVRDAHAHFGEEVRDVVITVPAYFGDNERAATLEAGEIAGLNVLEILSEPQAAALAFSVEKVTDSVDRHLLVYDLGGGTFDVTLVHATLVADAGQNVNLKVDTLCKEGNALLGGLDWDKALAEIVTEKVKETHGVDLGLDLANEYLLLDSCEKAKRHLSATGRVAIVPDAAGHQVEVSAAEFEDRTRHLLRQTKTLLEQVLDEAERQHGIGRNQVEVLLAGGATRMPMVRRMIEEVTGRPPLQYGNPELLVTIGAGYWAHLLEGDRTVQVPVPGPDGRREMKPVTGGISDISAQAVGVEVLRPNGPGGWERSNSVILPGSSRYEQEFRKKFHTTEDGMTEIPIVLYEGDAPDVEGCRPLMTFTITGLPAGRPAGQPVEVSLQYDRDGVLRGRAKDLSTGQACDIVVDRNHAAA